ncbi:DUF2585 family protein [bacterium]|nr:DUF2585 family protein [bacterium]
MKARAATPLLLLGQIAVLRLMGRRWWCKCNQLFFWSDNTWGSHNSQHLADAYSGSHIQHGFLFYFLTWKLFPQRGRWWRLNAALGLEVLWEIWENTPFIIERYRQDTISLDYVGDSIANSVSDTFCCGLGFLMAGSFPLTLSLLLYLAIEVTMLVSIRDSLTLNIWMLIAPNATLKAWQKAL